MNKKGFAATGILYTILLIFLSILVMALFSFESKKQILDNLKKDVVEEVKNQKENTNQELNVTYEDNSGASYPELYQGLIPVKYDSNGNTIVADLNEEWYDYDKHEWANAVLVKESAREKNIGEVLSDSEILQYYVWIPRYKYKLWNAENGSSNEQMIEITFEGKETVKSNGSTNGTWLTHPAFTFGSTELNGFWVGKFEMTGELNDNNNPTNLTIKPNEMALKNINVSKMFSLTREQDILYASNYGLNSNEIDTHMMKNMEWGAVAYLTSSIYGRYASSDTCVSGGCEIWMNPNSNLITGCAGDSVSSKSTKLCNDWKTTNGKHSSTTDNQYGIYDMSGGSWEYVMGNISSSTSSYIFNKGSSSFSIKPLDRYMETYINTNNANSNHIIGKLGDSTKEILKIFGDSTSGWFSDKVYIPITSHPWILRGGMYMYNDSSNGIFRHGYGAGDAYNGSETSQYIYRAVLSQQDGNYNGNGLEE